jgi:hypothetical protein
MLIRQCPVLVLFMVVDFLLKVNSCSIFYLVYALSTTKIYGFASDRTQTKLMLKVISHKVHQRHLAEPVTTEMAYVFFAICCFVYIARLVNAMTAPH